MSSPLISVIIPTWNRAHLLGETIQSVQQQTHSNFELLICDDGSTDHTRQMIEELARDDARIRFIEGEHRGLPAAPRNRGIAQSRGEWLAFLDSDDAWCADKLEKQLRAVTRHGKLAVCSNAVRYVPGSGEQGPFIYWNRTLIRFRNLLAGNLVINSSAMIHRSLIEKVQGFPEGQELKAVEDYALWLRVLTQTDFVYLQEQLVIYRDEPVTSVRKKQISIFSIKNKVFDDFRNWSGEKKIDARFRKMMKFWVFYQWQDLPAILINAAKKYTR